MSTSSSPQSPSAGGSSPAPTGLRRSVEAASRPVLLRLTSLPRALPFLVLLAILVVAVLVGGVAGVAGTAVVVLFVSWLMFLSWPRLSGSEKLGRLAVLAVAVALCVVQAFPRG